MKELIRDTLGVTAYEWVQANNHIPPPVRKHLGVIYAGNEIFFPMTARISREEGAKARGRSYFFAVAGATIRDYSTYVFAGITSFAVLETTHNDAVALATLLIGKFILNGALHWEYRRSKSTPR